jgi:proline dehydrogenase
VFGRGTDLQHALAFCQRKAGDGYPSTIGYFNAEDELPGRVAHAYLAALEAIETLRLDSYLSIKAPALGFEGVLLNRVIESAARTGVRLHFDSHDRDLAEPTFRAMARAARGGVAVGCTIPGRWRRSLEDVDRALAFGARVRVVKGQWPDPDAPNYDMREGFMAVVDRLAGRAAQVALASHDAPLARDAVARLRAAGSSAELELLRGLPLRASLHAASGLGVSTRFYVPFGVAWVETTLAHVRKHPRTVAWMLRDMTVDRFALGKL